MKVLGIFSTGSSLEQIGTYLNGMCLTNYKFSKKSNIGAEEKTLPKKIESIDVIHKNLNLQCILCFQPE